MAHSSNVTTNALTEDDLNALLVSAKINRETSELYARSPPHFTNYISRFQIRHPKEQFTLSQKGGANGSAFDISKIIAYFSVLTNSENEAPITKDLTLTCSYWHLFHYYLTGVAGSGTASVSVQYEDASAEAYVTEYGDPGGTIADWSHGNISKVFQTLIGDLGVRDTAPSEVELIEMLLGGDTKAYLDAEVESFGPLRKIIDEKLEDYQDYD